MALLGPHESVKGEISAYPGEVALACHTASARAELPLDKEASEILFQKDYPCESLWDVTAFPEGVDKC